jgi:choline dehydrogenase
VDITIKGINRTIQLTNTTAFPRHGAEIYRVPLPQCKDQKFSSDYYWECSVGFMTITVCHENETFKMGPDSEEDAVVDPRLQVLGINNLGAVDASIVPRVTWLLEHI